MLKNNYLLLNFHRPLFYIATAIFLLHSINCHAQLLKDYNGDGAVALTAFGDSITYGVGDGQSGYIEQATVNSQPSGYPNRLSQLLGVEVRNAGVSGELLTSNGFSRWPTSIQRSASDIVLILEGTNDVTLHASLIEYRRNMQQMINVAIATTRLPILMTLPPPCCDRIHRRPPTRTYSDQIKDKAAVNGLPLIDLAKVWDKNCPSSSSCDLYLQPEGLHPNSKGYTAMAHAIAAKLLDIDIFSPNGAAELEQATGLAPGSVFIIPDVAAEVTP